MLFYFITSKLSWALTIFSITHMFKLGSFYEINTHVFLGRLNMKTRTFFVIITRNSSTSFVWPKRFDNEREKWRQNTNERDKMQKVKQLSSYSRFPWSFILLITFQLRLFLSTSCPLENAEKYCTSASNEMLMTKSKTRLNTSFFRETKKNKDNSFIYIHNLDISTVKMQLSLLCSFYCSGKYHLAEDSSRHAVNKRL